MPQKLLTVVGGTGTQGLSIINAALEDGTYRVRATTRNPQSDKASQLRARGVELVQADAGNEGSLRAAFAGSAAVFGVTDFFEPFAKHGPETAVEVESAQGINIARAAARTASLEHFLWSTLPNGARLTGGEHRVPHFASKNRVDDYIKRHGALLAKTTFLWVACYGSNFQYPMFTPNLMKSSGSYVQLSPAAPTTPVWSIGSPLANVGRFALAALKQPGKTLPGRFVFAYVEETTSGRMLQDWAEVVGKRAVYVQASLADFDRVWPAWGLEMGAMMAMWDALRARSWTGEDGVLTKDDLGLDAAGLVGFKGAVSEMEWDALL